MRSYIQEIKLGIQILCQEKRYRLVWILGSTLFFLLILLVPVYTTPGNDILFQFHVWGLGLTLTLILLSALNGLLVSMQVYAFRHSRKKDSLAAGSSVIGIVTSVVVSIFACAACYSTLLAFVGLGFATFIVKYRIPLLIVAFGVGILAVYKNAARILGHCDTCKLAPRK